MPPLSYDFLAALRTTLGMTEHSLRIMQYVMEPDIKNSTHTYEKVLRKNDTTENKSKDYLLVLAQKYC